MVEDQYSLKGAGTKAEGWSASDKLTEECKPAADTSSQIMLTAA